MRESNSEEALRDAAERYRLTVESALDYAIFTVDAQGRVTSWPPGAEAVFGWSAEEIIGQKLDITFTPEDRAAGIPQQELSLARANGHAPDVRWHVRKDGAGVFIDGSMRPLGLGPQSQGQGAPTGYVKIGKDVTEKRRSEAALRASEKRFRQFADASADVLWIRDADTLVMEYLSPAFETIYGAAVDLLLGKGPAEWAAMIVPDDRASALDALGRARNGTVKHQFRIMRADNAAFRWIRNTDFPLHDEQGRVRRVAGISADVTEQRQLSDHQGVLLAELQHRVRNIMAMIRAIATRTARTASSVEEYAASIAGRLTALARTQALLTRSASASVDMAQVITAELAAQAARHQQYKVSGPAVEISPKAAEVLTLAIHELATNSLKYGAFAGQEGCVAVDWRVEVSGNARRVRVDWTERWQAEESWAPPTRRGFGTELIEGRLPYELGGQGSIRFGRGELDAVIEFPLQQGGSVLETDAPLASRVHGGGIDMSAEVDLAGRRVLVLEDDFYLAADTVQALRSAGAQVVGPFAADTQAVAALAGGAVDAAVVDVNLGSGPSFALPQALQSRSVPFLFLTGYDDMTIPPAYAAVPRFEKPGDMRAVIRAIATLSG